MTELLDPPLRMPRSARQYRIFLVDDHPLVREWLGQLLVRETDLIICGESAEPGEAFTRIGELQPDLAVIDISLRDGSGLELIKNLRAAHPNVALLVLSMHEESLYAERVLRAGARGYVMKRDTTKRILSAIRQVLSGGIYVSETFATQMTAKLVQSRAAATRSPVETLSDRELEVFRLLGRGRGTPQIADMLHLSLKTVQAYCARIKDKLGVTSMTELLREAVRFDAESSG